MASKKEFLLEESLEDYYKMELDKDGMINKAIKMYRDWQLKVEVPRVVKQYLKDKNKIS